MRNLIKKILKESEEDFSWFEEVPEMSKVQKFIYDKLKDCKLVESEKRPGWTKYIDSNGDFLFLDNIDTGTKEPILYADYDKIWLKCVKMGSSYEEFQKICTDMLYEVHKRKVFTAEIPYPTLYQMLYEVHKRKVFTAFDI